ncbi:MAG: DUF2090 domain-containing protein [Vicinamibacterales bacterium]
MLAADHRWQLEEWCDSRGVARARIPDAKALILDGFLAARQRRPAVAERGALLLDEQYASAEIRRAAAEGIVVATPAERAGAFPLEWAADPFDRVLTGSMVKVLVRHRPEYPRSRTNAEHARLRALADWCTAHARPLLVEVVVMREQEDEAAFEAEGRPAIVAAYIRDAYARGLAPDFWKMEGTVNPAAAAAIDAALVERDGPRFLVLGKGAGFELVEQWIGVAKQMSSAGGFAVGRTVYWSACADWLDGRLARDEAVSRVAANYERLVDAWERPAAATAPC